MGATKEMFTEMQEQESAQENSEFYNLIGRLQRKEETLSYSSLKEFGKSPRNFIAYKLKPRRKQTESQTFGSLCDCLITEPDNFNKLFTIVDNVPTTDKQQDFCDDIISGMSVDDAFSKNYSRGKSEDTYLPLQKYIECIKSNKQAVSTQQKDEAEKVIEGLKKSPLVMQYIDACTSFQNKREWTKNGWKFKGFTDGEGQRIIIDLKFTSNSDPEAFERDVMKYDYYMQMGMYASADEGLPECFFIAYDKSGNFSVIKLDYTLIGYGIRKYEYLLTKLEQCIKENRWNESYNFFDVQLRTMFKPKWVKGFETESFED